MGNGDKDAQSASSAEKKIPINQKRIEAYSSTLTSPTVLSIAPGRRPTLGKYTN
jgi:hypothetical protein